MEWTHVTNATHYGVSLYKDGNLIHSGTAYRNPIGNGASYNFSPYMGTPGDYTAKYTVVNGPGNGRQSDLSDVHTISFN